MSILTSILEVSEINLNKFRNPDSNEVLHDNQIECAVRILKQFDNTKYPRANYIVIKGFTQSGKTGVFTSLINIINNLNKSIPWKDPVLNIKKIVYITGDNSKALTSQTKKRTFDQTFSDEYNDDVINVIFVKQSDCTNDLKGKDMNQVLGENFSLDNTLIFLDESHYGTTNIKNKVPKWLESYGLDLKNNNSLQEKNSYIISNSATPYQEMESDIVLSKARIILHKGEGYVGIYDFAPNIIPVDSQWSNRNSSKDYLRWSGLMRETYNMIKATGENLCSIVRMSISNYEFHKYMMNLYFDTEVINVSNNSLNYRTMESTIISYCETGFNQSSGKYLMIIIVGGLRMGISIDNIVKNKIKMIYDYTSTAKAVWTTEQGLIGRMTGYREGDAWKNTKFYIRGEHWDKLSDYYSDVNNDELLTFNTPISSKKVETKIWSDEEGYDELDSNIMIGIDIIKDYENIHDSFGSDMIKIFGAKKFKQILSKYTSEIRKYLENKDVFFKNALVMDQRKKHTKNTSYSSENFNASDYHKKEYCDENIGRNAYTYSVDDRDINNIKLFVIIGVFKYYKIKNNTEKIQFNPLETMDTSIKDTEKIECIRI